MNDTFYLSNIVAQDFDNNGDFWNRFESFGRNLTKKFNDVRIISGPLWIPILEEDQAEQINKFNGRPLKKHKIMTYPVSHFLPANM
jgi:nuclease EXOG